MIGCVLIHGKNSGPKNPDCSLSPLVRKLSENFLVDEKNYFWGYNENYSRNFIHCIDEINLSIDKLKSQGATKIFLVGHSLGASAIIYYASQQSVNINGIILLAPAHNIHLPIVRENLKSSIAKAKELIEQGLGNQVSEFTDFDIKNILSIKTTPENYLSFFDYEGPCNLERNSKSFSNPVNVLCMSGARDLTQTTVRSLIYEPMLKTNKSKFCLTRDSHFTLPKNSHDTIVEWISTLE